MVAKFWWSGDLGKWKVHWLNWWQLCKPKLEGGLCFRDFYWFNLALLAKQAWRFINQPDSFTYSVFKARYFPTTKFLSARANVNASHVWRSIATARHVINKRSGW